METEGLFRTPGNSKSLFLIKSLSKPSQTLPKCPWRPQRSCALRWCRTVFMTPSYGCLKSLISCAGSEHCSEHCLFRTSVPNTVSETLWRSLWSLYKVFRSSPPRGGRARPSLPSGSFWRPYKDFIKTFKGAQRQCSEQMFGTDSVRNNVPSQHSL